MGKAPRFARPAAARRSTTKRQVRNKFLRVFAQTKIFRGFFRMFTGSVLLWIVLAVMTGFSAFALFSPYFDLKEIQINRDNPLLDADEIQTALKDFYGQNLLLLSKQDLRFKLEETFPEFRDIQISETWPNTLDLSIQLSPPLFTIFNDATANFSTISADGVVLQTEPTETLPALKLFQYEQIIQPRQKLLEKSVLDTIISAEKLLTERMEISIDSVNLLYNAQEIHFVTPQVDEIWLDLNIDVEKQLRKLELAAKEMGLYTRKFHHVDLRIPKQIFWEYQ